jgi:hypothetical protein
MTDQARAAVRNWQQAVDTLHGLQAGPPADFQPPLISRGLNPREIAIARSVFGDALDTSKIRINDGGIPLAGDNAVAFPNRVVFPQGTLSNPPPTFDAWLVHELTHVWQYQRGHQVPQLAVDAIGGEYIYGGPEGLQKAYAAGKPFGQFTFEQQGDIMRHYYERTQSGADTSAYLPYVNSVRHGMSDGLYPEPAPPPGEPV